MKTIVLAILLMAPLVSSAYAAEWASYFSDGVVEAFYDKQTKLSNSATVKWVYKRKTGTKPFQIQYRFKAYCSARQLFSVSINESMEEVDLLPGTLYELTFKMICVER